ncbi:DNA N-6-adenine-methyltransferase [Algiphilus sp.]|uniref:DNA N-6-adenine-methyltransferase n=1 Tax=Algiphilus sp. TaxID=1872431 RepID=UPI003CCC1540
MSTGMGSHQSSRMMKDEWLTPPYILDALGPFDLDPCAPVQRPWDTAQRHYTMHDNGLSQPWKGRVWCNPPYGRDAVKWLHRCADHGNAVALIFARTETASFRDAVWSAADAVLFLEGRLHFHHVNGTRAAANAGAPSALIAYGSNNVAALRDSRLAGAFITDWRRAA